MNNIIGNQFGLLRPIRIGNRIKKYTQKRVVNGETVIKERQTLPGRYWICNCNCGNEVEVDYYHLINGTTKSCGCLHKRKGKESPFFKGHGEIPLNYISIIKRSAKGGGILKRKSKEFSVDIKYLWELFLKQNRRCALSGIEISFDGTGAENKYSDTSKFTASLDRIDSEQGYVIGNVQWVHKHINIMKNSFNTETFLKYCKKVSEYNKL